MSAVCFYIDYRGRNPVGDFLDKNKRIKIKATMIIKNINEFGLISAIPHLKKLSGLPLCEIRILGKESARILYVHKDGEKIVLLHAFKKKTNKTPMKEIKIAMGRLSELLS